MAQGIKWTFNKKYAPALSTDCRYILFYGGRGSAKSFSTAQIFVAKCRNWKKYFRGILMREVLGDIRSSQFQEIKDMITDLGIAGEFHIRENTMEIEHKVSGNKIISKGFKKSAGNQTAKVKSIKDPTDIWIEEADEITEEDFRKADTSVRTTKADQVHIWLTFNPENEESWIAKKWFNGNTPKNRKDTLVIRSNYHDNRKFLQQSYIDTLEDMKESDPEYYKIYVLGLWGGGQKGRIFPGFQTISAIPEGYTTFYGLDFGFTNDPTALVKLVLHKNKLYVEQMIYETGLTSGQLAKRMRSLGLTGKDLVFADAADPRMIRELKLAGLNVVAAVKGPDSVRIGIDKLKEFEVYVHQDSADIWHESKYYVWHKDKDGKPTNQPVDAHNHAMDAMRYGLYSYYRRYMQRRGLG